MIDDLEVEYFCRVIRSVQPAGLVCRTGDGLVAGGPARTVAPVVGDFGELSLDRSLVGVRLRACGNARRTSGTSHRVGRGVSRQALELAPRKIDRLRDAEVLPNGNTLITESDNGRAFEVTREGEIVWEFLSPHRAGEDGEFVATLPEVIRLPKDFPLDWLQD
jgi:hypothetical protein